MSNPPIASPKAFHPHDTFFKDVFANPVHARQLLRRHAPANIIALIDLDSLEPLNASFVDDDLREHFADLPFRAKLKNGDIAYLCLLLEHKSYADRWVALQLLRYMLHIWDDARKQNMKTLPLIFPMVVYHGKRKWRVPKQFAAFFDLSNAKSMRPYIADFRYHLCDLTELKNADLGDEGLVSAALGAMKHIFDPNINQQLANILRPLRGLPTNEMLPQLQVVLRYLAISAEGLDRNTISEVLTETFTEDTKEGMMTLAQQWTYEGKQMGLTEGKQMGLTEGKQMGLTEGQLMLTLRQLHRRFSNLPMALIARVQTLPANKLGDLGEALLDFVKLDDLQQWLNTHESSALAKPA